MDWLASEYLDDGRWGVLTERNEIVVGVSWGLTKEQCKFLAEVHNGTNEPTPFEPKLAE